MYCTNCGRKLPEDGSPCVCQQQPAQPAQQTYTPPVQPQQNYGAPAQSYQPQNYGTPAQNYQQPYYAQPAVPYPQQGTPVHAMLKRFFTSPLFLTAAILMSVNVLFQIIAALVPIDAARIVNTLYSSMPEEFQYFLNPSDLYSALLDAQGGSTVLSVLGILIGGGLTAAAFWITYISAKNPSVPAAKTAGLTIMKVFTILGLIGMSIAAFVCVIGGIALIVSIAGMSDYRYGSMGDLVSFLLGACIAVLVVGLIVCVFEIIYHAKVLKMLNNAKNAIATGNLFGKASMFVAVINFITAFIALFGLFGDVAMYGWVHLPLGLSAAALNFVYGLLVVKFNKEVKYFGL